MIGVVGLLMIVGGILGIRRSRKQHALAAKRAREAEDDWDSPAAEDYGQGYDDRSSYGTADQDDQRGYGSGYANQAGYPEQAGYDDQYDGYGNDRRGGGEYYEEPADRQPARPAQQRRADAGTYSSGGYGAGDNYDAGYPDSYGAGYSGAPAAEPAGGGYRGGTEYGAPAPSAPPPSAPPPGGTQYGGGNEYGGSNEYGGGNEYGSPRRAAGGWDPDAVESTTDGRGARVPRPAPLPPQGPPPPPPPMSTDPGWTPTANPGPRGRLRPTPTRHRPDRAAAPQQHLGRRA